VKGKGVSFMENQVLWHYRTPDPEEMKRALAELGEEEAVESGNGNGNGNGK